VFDVYSLKPATKFAILDYFSREYELEYAVREGVNILTATGSKNNYYSVNKRAENIGYIPKLTSMDCIIQETKAILESPHSVV